MGFNSCLWSVFVVQGPDLRCARLGGLPLLRGLTPATATDFERSQTFLVTGGAHITPFGQFTGVFTIQSRENVFWSVEWGYRDPHFVCVRFLSHPGSVRFAVARGTW